jgi:phosphoribosylaminoimidazole carboxylase (NCAIR synthetase)
VNDRHVVFVAPFFMTATLRFVSGAASLAGAQLSLVSQDPLEKLPKDLAARLAGHWRVADCFDASQLVSAVQALAARFGRVERLIGSLEQLQVPLAEARAHLGLPGLTVEAARNFRDKNRMKDLFGAANLPCARHRLVRSAEEARAFVGAIGFPVVVKPPAGAGAASTFRLNDTGALEGYLRSFPLRAEAPVLFEEFLSGDEHSFDSVMLGGRLLWHSISVYRPSPLTVVENPWIQWCVLLPREIDGAQYAPIRAAGERALRVLGLETGMTHMEWFRRGDGGLAISEVAARPPGAQFTTLISYACDLDFYRAWPKLVVFDEFEPPAREYSAAAAYLRGIGSGRVRRVAGVDEVKGEFGEIMVEAQWPHPGQIQPAGYEGAGHVIFRHRDTDLVERALRRTVETVRVELG